MRKAQLLYYIIVDFSTLFVNFIFLLQNHLKIGLIRSKNTNLTVEDEDKLTDYLWAIV